MEIIENTSGRGKEAVVPNEIKRWNWGASLLTWIWGMGNEVYIAFLSFLPIFSIIMPFVLGMKGSEWAWRNKKWDSIEQFKRVQRRWTYWGIGVTAVFLILGILTVFVLVHLLMNSKYLNMTF